MGVMACHRHNCENIMCDRLILDGSCYICSDCYNELVESKNEWTSPMTKLEIREKIEYFMTTEPGHYIQVQNVDIDKEFNRLMGDYD